MIRRPRRVSGEGDPHVARNVPRVAAALRRVLRVRRQARAAAVADATAGRAHERRGHGPLARLAAEKGHGPRRRANERSGGGGADRGSAGRRILSRQHLHHPAARPLHLRELDGAPLGRQMRVHFLGGARGGGELERPDPREERRLVVHQKAGGASARALQYYSEFFPQNNPNRRYKTPTK